jgi:hypothetical protein
MTQQTRKWHRHKIRTAATPEEALHYICLARRWPKPEPGYQFNPRSRAKLFVAWVDRKVAIQLAPRIGSTTSTRRHNAAVVAGWTILYFSPEEIHHGDAEEVLAWIFERDDGGPP